jgi:hypothetical protein
MARVMFNQPFVREGLDHRRDGAGHNRQRAGQCSHRHEISRPVGQQQYVLQVVFDGYCRHAEAIQNNSFEATKDLF